jgi:hypothetical protein
VSLAKRKKENASHLHLHPDLTIPIYFEEPTLCYFERKEPVKRHQTYNLHTIDTTIGINN